MESQTKVVHKLDVALVWNRAEMKLREGLREGEGLCGISRNNMLFRKTDGSNPLTLIQKSC